MYRSAMRVRKELLGDEDLQWADGDGKGEVLHFERSGGWHVMMNGGKESVPLPKGAKVLIASSLDSLDDGHLPGETTVWFRMGA